MKRSADISRKTGETHIRVRLDLEGSGGGESDTPIPFFNHMLSLFTVHGFFDLQIKASGDIEVDFHHTVEDVGLVLGDAFREALGDRKGIRRFGHAVTPMDDALSAVTVDLSNRPYMVFRVDMPLTRQGGFDLPLTKEFFRALATRAGMNLHVHVPYGENAHHVIESIFKGAGRALGRACARDARDPRVRSTKGLL